MNERGAPHKTRSSIFFGTMHSCLKSKLKVKFVQHDSVIDTAQQSAMHFSWTMVMGLSPEPQLRVHADFIALMCLPPLWLNIFTSVESIQKEHVSQREDCTSVFVFLFRLPDGVRE